MRNDEVRVAVHVTEETCLIGQIDAAAGCVDGSLLLALRLLFAFVVGAAATLLYVLRHLVRLELPALVTYVRPERSGANGPMCWADPRGPLGPEGLDVGAECVELPVAALVRLWRLDADRGAPVLAVVVERWIAAGWTMRRGTAVR